MANIKSAEKANRQAQRRTARNRAAKSRLKSALKRARTAVAGGATDLKAGFSDIDKAAKRGVIKKNTANRYKSRLSAAAKRASAK
jgi:small subunit ribosomal protein S20